MAFKAIYLPMSDNPPDDKGGFLTENAAWDWVRTNHMCSTCKKEYQNYLNNVEENEDAGIFVSAFPACSTEWMVIDEEDKD